METVEAADSSLMDRDIMQVIFSLAMAGHQQHIPELMERMRHERGYVPGIPARTYSTLHTQNLSRLEHHFMLQSQTRPLPLALLIPSVTYLLLVLTDPASDVQSSKHSSEDTVKGQDMQCRYSMVKYITQSHDVYLALLKPEA